MYFVHLVFNVFILEPTMSNTFSERTQLVLILVIINRESEYEISWIVNSKVNY